MKKLTACIICLVLQGCATTKHGAEYVPLVDTKGQDSTNIAVDTAECQAYARQRPSAMDAAVGGAIAGVIIGAAIGAIIGGPDFRDYGMREGAQLGALGGAASEAEKAQNTQEYIIKKCLAGRGYNVLN